MPIAWKAMKMQFKSDYLLLIINLQLNAKVSLWYVAVTIKAVLLFSACMSTNFMSDMHANSNPEPTLIPSQIDTHNG